MKMKRWIFLLISLLALITCRTTSDVVKIENRNNRLEKLIRGTENSFPIRIKIVTGSTVKLEGLSQVDISDFITGQSIASGVSEPLELSGGDRITLSNSDKTFSHRITSAVTLKVRNNNFLMIDDKMFIGHITIYPVGETFQVIQEIPIETYLVSVLPSEMMSSFALEALKAQAVLARTYALHHITTRDSRRNFDVDNTVSYQVYGGFRDIMASPNFDKVFMAVFSTSGQIVMFDDKPIIAYFHANSGGQLSSGAEYFGVHSDKPYLVAKDDPYSLDMPGSKWDYSISRGEFASRLGIGGGDWDFVIGQNARVDAIKTATGNVYYPKEIRRKTGYSKLKSEKFSATVDGDTIRFHGIGYGHGVGMSQWGAQAMGQQGFTYKEIVDFYYPGVTLGKY